MSDPQAPVYRRLHPASLLTGLLRAAPQAAAAVAGSATMFGQRPFAELLLFGGAAAALAFVIAGLGWWRFRYSNDAASVVIESGLFQRRRRVIPLERVQDVAIERGPLARLIGAAVVRFETGGAGGDEGALDMVSEKEAQRLRDLVRDRPRSPAAEETLQAEHLLFALDTRRLLTLGLFNFSLVFFAAAFAAVQYLDDFGIFDPSDWLTKERAEAMRSEATIAVFAGLALALTLAGVLSGIVSTVAREFHFRLSAEPRGLRRRRGLVTLSEIVIPRHRVQAAVLRRGLVEGAFGFARLHLQTLGGATGEHGGRNRGREVVVPLGLRHEIDEVLADAHLPLAPPADAFRRASVRSVVRRAALPIALAMVAAIAALLADVQFGLAALAFTAVAGGQVVVWRRSHFALGSEALFVRRGLLAVKTFVIPFGRMQGFQLRQGPVQRALRLSSLLPDTAGGSTLDGPWIVDLDATAAQELLADLVMRERRAREALRRPLSPCG